MLPLSKIQSPLTRRHFDPSSPISSPLSAVRHLFESSVLSSSCLNGPHPLSTGLQGRDIQPLYKPRVRNYEAHTFTFSVGEAQEDLLKNPPKKSRAEGPLEEITTRLQSSSLSQALPPTETTLIDDADSESPVSLCLPSSETNLPQPISPQNAFPSCWEIKCPLEEAIALLQSQSLSPTAVLRVMKNFSDQLFKSRRENGPLFEPKALLTLSELNGQLQAIGNKAFIDEGRKLFREIINVSLQFMKEEQKKQLHEWVVRDPIVQNRTHSFLREYIFNKYYVCFEPIEMSQLPSEIEVLHHVLNRVASDEPLATPENKELLKEVRQLAEHLLKKAQAGEHVSPHAFFHATTGIQNVPSFLKDGIRVEHQQKYPGAFVSTQVHPSYGNFAFAVSGQTLARKQFSHIERRSNQDGGAVWLGASSPLSPIKNRMIHQLNEEESNELREVLNHHGCPDCVLVGKQAHDLFTSYARELNASVPLPKSPKGTPLYDIQPRDEPPEPL